MEPDKTRGLKWYDPILVMAGVQTEGEFVSHAWQSIKTAIEGAWKDIVVQIKEESKKVIPFMTNWADRLCAPFLQIVLNFLPPIDGWIGWKILFEFQKMTEAIVPWRDIIACAKIYFGWWLIKIFWQTICFIGRFFNPILRLIGMFQ